MSESNGQGEYRRSLIMTPGERRCVNGAKPDERYPVPTAGRFTAETLDGHDLAQIAAKLIGMRPTLKHLGDVEIDYLWKKNGGKKAGAAVLGNCQRVSGIWGHYTEAKWSIWLAADNCEFLTNWQIEACLCHQLLHAGEGEGGEPAMIGHDFEGFAKELEWYGCWTEGLTVAGRALGQLQLPMQGTIPLAEVEKATEPLEGTPLGDGRQVSAVEERELAAAGVE